MRKYSDHQQIKSKHPHIRYILCCVIIILSVIQMFVLNSLSTAGSQLTETEVKIDKMANKNEILEAKVASSSSMTMVFVRAKKIGLEKSPETVSLQAPLPVAQIEKIFN